MQRLSVHRHDRELPAYQHAGIYHRVKVRIEPGPRRYADPQNCNLGLTLRIRRQKRSIPALAGFDEFPDDRRRPVHFRTAPDHGTTGLQEKNNKKARNDSNGMFHHGVTFSLIWFLFRRT
jgi:hypothetical protein